MEIQQTITKMKIQPDFTNKSRDENQHKWGYNPDLDTNTIQWFDQTEIK